LARRSKKQQKKIEELLTGILVMIALGSYLYTNSIAITGLIVGLSITLIVTFTIYKGRLEREKLKKSGMHVIDKMDGIQFEDYLKELFKSRGYIVEGTKASGDFGVDLILKNKEKKIAVQAKRYSKNVGIKAVQEVSSAMKYYSVQESWVVTNSYYTAAAEKLALTNGVRLIDRDELIDIILKMNPNAIPNPKRAMNGTAKKDAKRSTSR
jgi:restriction system protein